MPRCRAQPKGYQPEAQLFCRESQTGTLETRFEVSVSGRWTYSFKTTRLILTDFLYNGRTFAH